MGVGGVGIEGGGGDGQVGLAYPSQLLIYVVFQAIYSGAIASHFAPWSRDDLLGCWCSRLNLLHSWPSAGDGVVAMTATPFCCKEVL